MLRVNTQRQLLDYVQTKKRLITEQRKIPFLTKQQERVKDFEVKKGVFVCNFESIPSSYSIEDATREGSFFCRAGRGGYRVLFTRRGVEISFR